MNPVATVPPRDLRGFHAPPGAATFGLGAYLTGMGIAFVWLFIAFLVMRGRTPVEHVNLPAWFWLSTFVVLVSSVLIHWAYLSARADRAAPCRAGVGATLALGVVFLALQVTGFVSLFEQYAGDLTSPAQIVTGTSAATTSEAAQSSPARLYQLIVIMAGLHGLHLLGGIGRLVALFRRVSRTPQPITETSHLLQMVLYWHFLSIVWLLMFGLFTLSHGMAAPMQ